jgi:hypothetical protein
MKVLANPMTQRPYDSHIGMPIFSKMHCFSFTVQFKARNAYAGISRRSMDSQAPKRNI